MKRYTIDHYTESTPTGPACNVTMVEDAGGEWVRYEDAERLRAENDTMRDMLQRIVANPGEVCWTIAVQETLDAVKRKRYTGQYCQICGKTLDEYTPPNASRQGPASAGPTA